MGTGTTEKEERKRPVLYMAYGQDLYENGANIDRMQG
jgi:hypothetical protein